MSSIDLLETQSIFQDAERSSTYLGESLKCSTIEVLPVPEIGKLQKNLQKSRPILGSNLRWKTRNKLRPANLETMKIKTIKSGGKEEFTKMKTQIRLPNHFNGIKRKKERKKINFKKSFINSRVPENSKHLK